MQVVARSRIVRFLPPDGLEFLRFWLSLPDVKRPAVERGVVRGPSLTRLASISSCIFGEYEPPAPLISSLSDGPYRQQAVNCRKAGLLFKRVTSANDHSFPGRCRLDRTDSSLVGDSLDSLPRRLACRNVPFGDLFGSRKGSIIRIVDRVELASVVLPGVCSASSTSPEVRPYSPSSP